MKKVSLMMVVFLLSLFIVASSQIGIPRSEAADTIKIGCIVPMTGTGAQWGERMSAGALLRAEEENKAGGIHGKKIEIVVCDHKGIPREGVACASKLIHVEHVPVFEVVYSGVVMACIPTANQNKTVLLNTAALNPKIRQGGEWIFSIMPLGDYEGKAQVEFVWNDLKLTKAAIMYINNAFGVAMAKVVKDEYEKVGGKVLAYEAHAQGGTDFRTQLTKIKALKPQVIFLESYYMESGLIVKQAAELGLTGVQWISYAGVQQPQFIEIAGKAAEGFICTVAGWDPEDSRKIVQDFKKNIKAKYNVEPEMYGAMTYDGVKLLAEVMRKHGTTAEDIRKGMHKVRDFAGVTGTGVNLDKDGMVIKKLTLNILKNGKWVKYK
jgi:branched-chain amino acid transport system substrate-binding protein